METVPIGIGTTISHDDRGHLPPTSTVFLWGGEGAYFSLASRDRQPIGAAPYGAELNQVRM